MFLSFVLYHLNSLNEKENLIEVPRRKQRGMRPLFSSMFCVNKFKVDVSCAL